MQSSARLRSDSQSLENLVTVAIASSMSSDSNHYPPNRASLPYAQPTQHYGDPSFGGDYGAWSQQRVGNSVGGGGMSAATSMTATPELPPEVGVAGNTASATHDYVSANQDYGTQDVAGIYRQTAENIVNHSALSPGQSHSLYQQPQQRQSPQMRMSDSYGRPQQYQQVYQTEQRFQGSSRQPLYQSSVSATPTSAAPIVSNNAYSNVYQSASQNSGGYYKPSSPQIQQTASISRPLSREQVRSVQAAQMQRTASQRSSPRQSPQLQSVQSVQSHKQAGRSPQHPNMEAYQQHLGSHTSRTSARSPAQGHRSATPVAQASAGTSTWQSNISAGESSQHQIHSYQVQPANRSSGAPAPTATVRHQRDMPDMDMRERSVSSAAWETASSAPAEPPAAAGEKTALNELQQQNAHWSALTAASYNAAPAAHALQADARADARAAVPRSGAAPSSVRQPIRDSQQAAEQAGTRAPPKIAEAVHSQAQPRRSPAQTPRSNQAPPQPSRSGPGSYAGNMRPQQQTPASKPLRNGHGPETQAEERPFLYLPQPRKAPPPTPPASQPPATTAPPSQSSGPVVSAPTQTVVSQATAQPVPASRSHSAGQQSANTSTHEAVSQAPVSQSTVTASVSTQPGRPAARPPSKTARRAPKEPERPHLYLPQPRQTVNPANLVQASPTQLYLPKTQQPATPQSLSQPAVPPQSAQSAPQYRTLEEGPSTPADKIHPSAPNQLPEPPKQDKPPPEQAPAPRPAPQQPVDDAAMQASASGNAQPSHEQHFIGSSNQIPSDQRVQNPSLQRANRSSNPTLHDQQLQHVPQHSPHTSQTSSQATTPQMQHEPSLRGAEENVQQGQPTHQGYWSQYHQSRMPMSNQLQQATQHVASQPVAVSQPSAQPSQPPRNDTRSQHHRNRIPSAGQLQQLPRSDKHDVQHVPQSSQHSSRPVYQDANSALRQTPAHPSSHSVPQEARHVPKQASPNPPPPQAQPPAHEQQELGHSEPISADVMEKNMRELVEKMRYYQSHDPATFSAVWENVRKEPVRNAITSGGEPSIQPHHKNPPGQHTLNWSQQPQTANQSSASGLGTQARPSTASEFASLSQPGLQHQRTQYLTVNPSDIYTGPRNTPSNPTQASSLNVQPTLNSRSFTHEHAQSHNENPSVISNASVQLLQNPPPPTRHPPSQPIPPALSIGPTHVQAPSQSAGVSVRHHTQTRNVPWIHQQAISRMAAEYLSKSGKPIASETVLQILDTSDNYVHLCERLEGMGYWFDRGVFARMLLDVVEARKEEALRSNESRKAPGQMVNEADVSRSRPSHAGQPSQEQIPASTISPRPTSPAAQSPGQAGKPSLVVRLPTPQLSRRPSMMVRLSLPAKATTADPTPAKSTSPQEQTRNKGRFGKSTTPGTGASQSAGRSTRRTRSSGESTPVPAAVLSTASMAYRENVAQLPENTSSALPNMMTEDSPSPPAPFLDLELPLSQPSATKEGAPTGSVMPGQLSPTLADRSRRLLVLKLSPEKLKGIGSPIVKQGQAQPGVVDLTRRSDTGNAGPRAAGSVDSARAQPAVHIPKFGVPIADCVRLKNAKRRRVYNPRNIAKRILVACGLHPTQVGLNEHLLPLKENLGLDSHADLDTVRWDIIDPEPIAVDDDVGMMGDDEGDMARAGGVATVPRPRRQGSGVRVKPGGALPPTSRARRTRKSAPEFSQPEPARLQPTNRRQSTGHPSTMTPADPVSRASSSVPRRGSGLRHVASSAAPTSAAISAVTTADSGRSLKKRRVDGRGSPTTKRGPSPGPAFKKFRCKWQNCTAELHNYETLQRHVFKSHKNRAESGPHVCRWAMCQKPPSANSDGVEGEILRYEYTQHEQWQQHVLEHLNQVRATLGLGPVALPSDTESGASDVDYLSDHAGRPVTPIARQAPEGHHFVPPPGFHTNKQFKLAHGITGGHKNRNTVSYKQALERARALGAGVEDDECRDIFENDDGTGIEELIRRVVPAPGLDIL